MTCFWGPGESEHDRKLMAHELTHVAQQSATGARVPQMQIQVGDPHSAAEDQADAVADAVTEGDAVPAALLIDAGPLQPGQMLKSEFLAQLRPQVTVAATDELGPIRAIAGCPYIDRYFARYATEPAAHGEAMLRRFVPAIRGARHAADIIPLVVVRIREGVRIWRDTGRPPPEIR